MLELLIDKLHDPKIMASVFAAIAAMATVITLAMPLLVTDQGGVWSFTGGELDTWRQVVGGVPSAVPVYPG